MSSHDCPEVGPHCSQLETVTSPHGVLLHAFLEASSLAPVSTFAASGQSSTYVFGLYTGG
eukprot:7330699-Prorocentrum_lima.AAC.1